MEDAVTKKIPGKEGLTLFVFSHTSHERIVKSSLLENKELAVFLSF